MAPSTNVQTDHKFVLKPYFHITTFVLMTKEILQISIDSLIKCQTFPYIKRVAKNCLLGKLKRQET